MRNTNIRTRRRGGNFWSGFWILSGVAVDDILWPSGGGGGGITGRTDGWPEVTNGRPTRWCDGDGGGSGEHGRPPAAFRCLINYPLPPSPHTHTPLCRRTRYIYIYIQYTARSPRRWLPVQISRYLLYRARSWVFVYIYICTLYYINVCIIIIIYITAIFLIFTVPRVHCLPSPTPSYSRA